MILKLVSIKTFFAFISLLASKGQVAQSSIKKEPELVAPKKKVVIGSQKNVRSSPKPGNLQEGPVTVEEESIIVPIVEENISQQVRNSKQF